MVYLGCFPKAGGADAAADSRLCAAADAGPAGSSGADCVSRSGGSGDCIAEASAPVMAAATS